MPDYQIRAINKLPAVCACARDCFLCPEYTLAYILSIHPNEQSDKLFVEKRD